MGNQHSNTITTTDIRRPFTRATTGTLGLAKSELDKRCQPSGLYDTCHWEERAIRKLIGDGKAAARLKGSETRTIDTTHECPICFLYYSEINVTKCCHANICTECFLQVRPQREKHSTCPFCNHTKLNIEIAKQLTEQEILDQQKEEEAAEQARIRARQQENSPHPTTPDKSESFGSSLERDTRVAMSRARSESFASSEHSQDHMTETSLIQSMAMTPEDRRRLEAEMQNQNLHPLALQIEAEAQQRRAQNERNYHRSHSDNNNRGFRTSEMYGRNQRRSRVRGSRDWNQIVEAFEGSGNGAINSLDDLVVLEAAILLSREEESRRQDGDGEDFDAARHARDGFPLVQSFLASRGRDDGSDLQQHVQNLARTLNTSRRRSHLLRSSVASHLARSMPETAFETATLLMRGISEEEQLAMAIAASLQDQHSSSDNNSNDNTTNTENNTNEGDDDDDDDEDTIGNDDGDQNGSSHDDAVQANQDLPDVDLLSAAEETTPVATGNLLTDVAVGVVVDQGEGSGEHPHETEDTVDAPTIANDETLVEPADTNEETSINEQPSESDGTTVVDAEPPRASLLE